MADLIRVGLVLDSSGVVRGAREATQAFSQVRQAAQGAVLTGDRLVDNFRSLQTQFQRGALTVTQYRDALRTTRADLQSFTNTTRLSAEQERYFATQAQAMSSALRTVEGQALRTQTAMIRVSGGVQSLAFSMQGGRLSTMGLLSALGTLGIGSPAFIAITAGLGAIAAVMLSLKNNADDAVESMRSLSGFSRGRLQGIVSRLESQQTPGRWTTDAQGRQVWVPGGVLGAADATELTNARAALADMNRSPGASRGGGGRAAAEQRLGVRGITSKPSALKGEDALGGGVIDNMKGSLDELKNLTKGFGGQRDELLDIGSSLSSGLSAIGASLADGFKGIGKAVLGIIGGMMQQIGHAMITFGSAGKAIRAFIKNPALSIAVGAGLIVLGAALSRSAQGVVNRGGEGGGGGGAGVSMGSGFSGEATGARGATIIQIIGQRSGEVIAEHTYEAARYANRGGSSGVSSAAQVIPVTGQVVVRRV